MKLKQLSYFAVLLIFITGCSKDQQKVTEPVKTETKRNDSALTKEKQTNLTVEEIVQQFKDGNERFLKGTTIQNNFLQQVEQTGNQGQFPKAIVLSCIDSRGPAEVLFDKGIGEIFGTRVAGNYADEGVIGGIEYACKVAGAKVIIVLGHTDCGAVKSACDNVKLGNITYIMDELKPAVDSVKGFTDDRTSKNKDFVKEVMKKNVQLTMKKILNMSEILSGMEKEGKIVVIGGIYDVNTGKVDFMK
jgi:carbonic anhydrase